MAELAWQKLEGEIAHAQNEIASWQQTPLDEISPPTLTEKSLPFAAGTALLFGLFSATRHNRPTFDAFLAGLGLLGLYAFIRGQRRDQAQRRVQNVVGRWMADLEKRQQQMERRGS